MADAELTRHRVERLLRAQRGNGDVGGGTVATLERLCRCVCQDLDLFGAAVTLMPGTETHVVSAASGPGSRRLEESQFGAGEGPTSAAFASRRPVLVADLRVEGALRWPGWVAEALDAGVNAVYAFPLQVGASVFGVLALYAADSPGLDTEGLHTALVFADLATETLLDSSMPTDGLQLEHDLDKTLGTHAHIYQAQGMLMVDLGISLAEALARMRAHAWATGQDLATLAGEIVAGRLTLPRDEH
ncbi:GAF and ANTAR domain-containing protein [Nocardioides conyzicola]|uniref:ANTAR domain-containing protein n=1 Tax=Nocardioides conyzicola TaxID=1651781 RepID=A0ABP8XRA4_9ACTN